MCFPCFAPNSKSNLMSPKYLTKMLAVGVGRINDMLDNGNVDILV